MEKKITLINCALFIIVVVAVFAIIVALVELVNFDVFSNTFLTKEYGWVSFIVIATAFLIWGYVGYCAGIIEYKTGFGDQTFYWQSAYSVNPFKTASQLQLKFRGYFPCWIGTLCIKIGSMLNVSGEIFWIGLLCITMAFLIGYVMPRIYELLTGNKARFYQIILFATMYVIIWGYDLMRKGADAGGAAFFFISVWAFLESKDFKKWYFPLVSGASMGIAISHRMAYKHALYFSVILLTIVFIYKLIKKEKIMWKNALIMLSLFAIAILVISMPTLIANLKNGIISPFPYNVAHRTGNGNTFASADGGSSFHTGVLVYSYPYGVIDQSFINMRNRAELRGYAWSMPTILRVYSTQWFDTMLLIAKKLFFAFSPVKSIGYKSLITGYPNGINFKHSTEFMIMPLLDYIFEGIALFVVAARHKCMKVGEKALLAVVFFSLLLPQTFVHVEWRYFYPGFILLYYLVSFKATDYFREVKSIYGKNTYFCELGKITIWISFYTIFCEMLFWTFYNVL